MRIIFISDEDRCRGPMARAIAEKIARANLLEGMVFDSCGITASNNEGPTVEAASFLKGERINILNHRTKPLSPQLADGADVLMAMTAAQTKEAKRILGDDYAPKVVLLNDAIDLATKRMDIDPPENATVGSYRRLYASLSASMGRLIRTLEDPQVAPEFFGAKTMPKKMKHGTAGAGARSSEQTIDPVRRQFLSNTIFDLLERAYEPHTTSVILEALRNLGQELSILELEELLRQDLHGEIRLDKDGVWHSVSGAREKRREKAKADARARAQAARDEKQEKTPPPTSRQEKLTEELAFEILGIKADSPVDDVKKKYRDLLKRYHPDKFHDDVEFRDMAEQKAKRINEAWTLVKGKFLNVGEEVSE